MRAPADPCDTELRNERVLKMGGWETLRVWTGISVSHHEGNMEEHKIISCSSSTEKKQNNNRQPYYQQSLVTYITVSEMEYKNKGGGD